MNRFNVNNELSNDLKQKFGTSNNLRFSNPIFRQANANGMDASGHQRMEFSQEKGRERRNHEVEVQAVRSKAHEKFTGGDFIREIKSSQDDSNQSRSNTSQVHYDKYARGNFSFCYKKIRIWVPRRSDFPVHPAKCAPNAATR
jgi:hypothetical protein